MWMVCMCVCVHKTFVSALWEALCTCSSGSQHFDLVWVWSPAFCHSTAHASLTGLHSDFVMLSLISLCQCQGRDDICTTGPGYVHAFEGADLRCKAQWANNFFFLLRHLQDPRYIIVYIVVIQVFTRSNKC